MSEVSSWLFTCQRWLQGQWYYWLKAETGQHLSKCALNSYAHKSKHRSKGPSGEGGRLRTYILLPGLFDCIFQPAHSFLYVIFLRNFFLDGSYTTNILEELSREESAIVSYEFLRSSIFENLVVYTVRRNFVGGDTLHGYRLGHLRKPVRDDKEVFVLP